MVEPEGVARAAGRRRLFQFGAASRVKDSVGFGAVAAVPHFALAASTAGAGARSPSGKVPRFTLLSLRRWWRLGAGDVAGGRLTAAALQPVSLGCHVPRYRHVDGFSYRLGYYLQVEHGRTSYQ